VLPLLALGQALRLGDDLRVDLRGVAGEGARDVAVQRQHDAAEDHDDGHGQLQLRHVGDAPHRPVGEHPQQLAG